MKTRHILVSFFLILFLLSYGENYIMKDFYPQIDKLTNNIRDDIINGVNPEENINKLAKFWEDNKKVAFCIADHSEYEYYDDYINAMQEYNKIGKREYIYYKSIDLENLNNELCESTKYNLKNIF